MTGFSGTFTSATGARFQLTPTDPSSAAIAAATDSVTPVSSITPSAAPPGYELPVCHSRRVTSPPSSSIANSRSARSARSEAQSEASSARDGTLVAKSITPPPPSATKLLIQSGATAPTKLGSTHARANLVSSFVIRGRRRQ